MPKDHLSTNGIPHSSPHSESFKGFLLASYKSIANVARAHKITRLMLLTYLLLLVVIPPIIIIIAFLTLPTQTARFFNFRVQPDGQILGESTDKGNRGNVLGKYVSTLLEPQAAATVQALRIIRPESVSGVVLPAEQTVVQTQLGQAALTTSVVSQPGADGQIGLQGPAGQTGPQGPSGSTGPAGSTSSLGTLTTGTGLIGNITGGNLTLNLDTNTLSIASGKTFTVNKTITFGGNDGTSFSLPSSSDTLVGLSSTDILTSKTIAAGSNTISGLTISNFASGNISQWTNNSGYLTSEADTLALVTGRGAATSTLTVFNGGLTVSAVNDLTITTTSGTLTIGNGKTFTANNSLALSGTDGTTFTFPASSDDVVGRTVTQTLTNKTIGAGSNTISGLTNSNLSGSAGITNANLANSSLTVTAGSGLNGGGSISLGSSAAFDISLTSSGTTGATSSNSGLEVSSSGLSLIKGCSDNQLLKWTDAGGWACASDLAGSDIQNISSYDTTEALTNIGSSQVTVTSVTITPATATGDVYVRAKAEVLSSNNTDQSLVLSIEDNETCTGTTLATNTITITSGNGTVIGDFELSAVEVDAGTTAQSYSLCASTATGDSDIKLYEMFATVIDTGADLAEIYTTNDDTIEPGDIVSIDSTLSTGMRKSIKEYDSEILGIVTTNPGLVIGSVHNEGVKALPIALAGRVPVKVSTINGEIKAGDYLTSSKIPGIAMKATKPGQVIGVAMSSFDGEVIGSILAFVRNGSYQNDEVSNFEAIGFGEIDFSSLDKIKEASTSGTPTNINNANQAETFISKLLNKLVFWFADTSNGISDFFANRVHTKTLCIGEKDDETCITKPQLDKILLRNDQTDEASEDGQEKINAISVTPSPSLSSDGAQPVQESTPSASL